MASTNLVFDGNSLQTANILTQNIDHASLANKILNMQPLAHANKSVIPFVDYPTKTIVVSGIILDSSIAALDNRLDTFRGYFNGINKNLDIDYGTGQRRYIATLSNLTISRPGGLLYAGFEATFVCTHPFGFDTSPTTLINDSAVTSATYAPTCTFTGSAPIQRPVITLTMLSNSSSSSNLVSNPGFEVDTAGWNVAAGTLTRVTTQFKSGVAAGQVVNAASATNGYYGQVYLNITGLSVGSAYTVSAWVKGNAGGESLTIGQYAGSVGASATLTTSWQKVTFTFIAAFTTYGIGIGTTAPASGTWFLDDITAVVNGPSPLNIGNAATGQTIAIPSRAYNANDVLIIDSFNKSVKVNGGDIGFSGAFPEFKPGAGGFTYSDSFLTRSFNFKVDVTVAWQ